MQMKIWLLALVIAALLPSFSASPALQAAAPTPDLSAIDESKYAVQWTITVNGSASGSSNFSSWSAYRNVLIQGSATSYTPPEGFSVTEPFQLTVTDSSHSIENGNCWQEVVDDSITDPGRYNGGPDQFWVYPTDFWPREREDGSWYMDDPFYLSFYINGQLARDFNYRRESHYRDFCNSDNSYNDEEDRTFVKYMSWYDFQHGFQVPFEGDQEGVVFRKSQAWEFDSDVNGFPVKMHVSFDATVRRIGGCADKQGPIDVNDPAIKDVRLFVSVDNPTIPPNQGDTLQPPDPATLTVRVTCEGVPVKNVSLKVAVDAKPNSGGHQHTNGANPRPRGFLRGPKDKNYVEITRKKPDITVVTDNQGEVQIRFLPGRDYDSGNRGGRCAGDQRGVAGDYKVDIVPTLAKFQNRKVDKTIRVERTDFVPLADGDNYFIQYNSAVHPLGTSGLSPTLQVIQELANAFNAAQVEHNAELVSNGKPAWPIKELGIIDISLPDGGLFDTGGTNVCADGQPHVGFIPWQIPHQTHLSGRGIDISTGPWVDNTGRYKWWRNTLRALGCNYGTWAKEAVFHLDADQESGGWGDFHQGCTYTPSSAASDDSASPAMVTIPHAGPDLFVTLLPDSADNEVVRAAPGEVLTYTVGVNNMFGTAPAHGAEMAITLPAGLTFVRAVPAPTRMDAPNQPVWVVGDLPAGAFPELFDVAFQVDAGVQPGAELALSAAATTTDAESNLENNSDQDTLYGRSAGPDLAVFADLEAVPMTADAPVTVTFSVQNVGSASAANASLVLTLPVSATVLSAAPIPTTTANRLTWNLGTLAPTAGQPITLALNLSAAATAPVDPLTGLGAPVAFSWQAATPGDVDQSNNSGLVESALTLAGHDAQVTLDAGGPLPGVLVLGEPMTFTVAYSNLGNQSAPTSTLSLHLGVGLRFVDAQPPATQVAAGEPITWNLGNLPVGAEGVIVVHAQTESVAETENLTFAELSSAGFDIAPANNVAYDSRERVQSAFTGTPGAYLPLLGH